MMESLAALVEWATLSGSQLAAMSNAAWAAASACLFAGLWLLKHELKDGGHPALIEALGWARLPPACVFFHRWYWNLAIFYRPPEPPPYFNEWFLEHRNYLIILIAGVIYGSYRTFRPVLRPEIKNKVMSAAAAFILASCATAIYLA